MALEVDQASQQLQEEVELQNEKQRMGTGIRIKIKQVTLNLNQLKSFEVLKSALTVFTSNTKFMLFMILSIIPYFAFMVFFEIKLQKAIHPWLYFQTERNVFVAVLTDSRSNRPHITIYGDSTKKAREFCLDVVQLCLFYLALYPVLEVLSMIITIKIAAKAHTGDREATLKEVLFQKINNLKGLSVTCLCVHLLSILTLVGLIWIVVKCRKFIEDFYIFGYNSDPMEVSLFIISIALHSAVFIVLLYKYLEWSAFWMLSMVISILGEETGIWAFGMADCYGKHCKQIGFHLMLIFFTFGNILRLPCLFAGLCLGSVGVFVAAAVIATVCLGNLVKWITFVLYFYDCKQQTLEKKADVEVGNVKNADDL